MLLDLINALPSKDKSWTRAPTMDVGSMDSFTAEWLCSTGVIWNARNSESCENTSGIRCRIGKGGISMHGAYSDKLETWVMSGEKDGEGVL